MRMPVINELKRLQRSAASTLRKRSWWSCWHAALDIVTQRRRGRVLRRAEGFVCVMCSFVCVERNQQFPDQPQCATGTAQRTRHFFRSQGPKVWLTLESLRSSPCGHGASVKMGMQMGLMRVSSTCPLNPLPGFKPPVRCAFRMFS